MTVRTSMGKPKTDSRNGTHELDPHRRPGHTVTTKAGEWVIWPHMSSAGAGAARRMSANAARRPVDEPAPTMYFGQRLNSMWWRRG